MRQRLAYLRRLVPAAQPEHGFHREAEQAGCVAVIGQAETTQRLPAPHRHPGGLLQLACFSQQRVAEQQVHGSGHPPLVDGGELPGTGRPRVTGRPGASAGSSANARASRSKAMPALTSPVTARK